jgi:hypothetical protein
MADHSFNPFIAKKYDINCAIFINSLIYWTRLNASNEHNYHDGRYWTFNTPEAMTKYFPYWSVDQIKRIIKKLSGWDLILISNYNKKGYDRTNWYALSDKALLELNLDKTCLQPLSRLIERNRPMDRAKSLDGLSEIALPIPVTNPDTKTKDLKPIGDSSNQPIKKVSSPKKKDHEKDERFQRFYSAYPKKQKPADAYKAFKSVIGDDDGLLDKVLGDISDRLTRHSQWRNKTYIPYPATYLRSYDFESEIIDDNVAQQEVKKAVKEQNDKRVAELEKLSEKERLREIEKLHEYNANGKAYRAITKAVGIPDGLKQLKNSLGIKK